MKRMMLVMALLAATSITVADTVYIDGKPCFQSGNTVNCGGTLSNPGQSEEARAARAETRRLREQSQKLDACLRTADWRGMPGRSECQSMYGN